MTNSKIISKGGLLGLLLCFICYLPGFASAAGTFENPDFAFPVDVRKDAVKVFEKSMKEGDALNAIKAAMQLNVADQLTSTDSIGVSVERYQQIASRFGEPWNSLAEILKGKVLAQAYMSNRWTYDKRVLPADELNPEPTLWSGEQFRTQIQECCRRSLQKNDQLIKIPIKDISSLLTSTEKAELYGLTALDFVTYQAIDLLERINMSASSSQPIPFICGDDKSSKGDAVNDHPADFSALTLIDSLIEADKNRAGSSGELAGGAGALMLARIAKVNMSRNSGSEKTGGIISGFAKEVLDMYPEGSALRPYVVISLYRQGNFDSSDLVRRQELYNLVKTTAASADDTERKILDTIGLQLLAPRYNLRTDSQWLPGKRAEIMLTASNVAEGYLLLVPLEDSVAESQKLTYGSLKAKGAPMVLCHLSQPADKPTEVSDTITVEPLNPGYYALVMSQTKDLGGIFNELLSDTPDIVLVSGLSAFCSDEAEIIKGVQANSGNDRKYKADVKTYLYVTHSTDNSPVKGARVDFTSTNYRGKGEKRMLTTDADGKVALPFENCKAVITADKNRLIWNGGKGYASVPPSARLSASILTDLALYHPGDSIQAVVIVSRCDNNNVSVVSGKKLKLLLRDANYKEVQSVELTSDESGRAIATLQIPSEGLTGNFRLEARDSNSVIGSAYVQVADYKAPGFRVILDKPEVTYTDSVSDLSQESFTANSITLSGSVSTYAGAPLANAKVLLDVTYVPWWRPWIGASSSSTDYGVTVFTDARGNFTTELSLKSEDLAKYRLGFFSAVATATSEAGETQASSPARFSLGEGYDLVYEGNTDFEVAGDELTFPIKVKDILGNSVRKSLAYEIIKMDYSGKKEEKIIDQGEFDAPGLKIESSRLPSGAYLLKVILAEACRVENADGAMTWRPDTLTQRVILWREDDKRPPVETVLWVPQAAYYAQPGESHVEVTLGSGYPDEWIFCQTVDRFGTLRREWLRADGKNLKLKIEAPAEGEMKRLYLAGNHDLESAVRFISIFPAEESRKTEFKVETFRDKLIPGSGEKWRFRLLSGWPKEKDPKSKYGMKGIADASVIAVLSNEALDAITPFKWNFSPRSAINYNTVGRLRSFEIGETYSNDRLSPYVPIDYSSVDFELPEFLYSNAHYLYGNIASGLRKNKTSSNIVLRGGSDAIVEEVVMMDMAETKNAMSLSAPSAAYKMQDGGSENAVLAEEEVVDDAEAGSAQSSDAEDVEMRGMEMPLAFFKPLLNADKDGFVDIEFDVPNFNTTWALQLVGYDRQMHSAILRETAVASKPVMVSTSMPRFLLTGDKAQITATAFNNTESDLDMDVSIEIFDVVSGKILASRKMPFAMVEGNTSVGVTVDFNVPSDMDRVGVRAMAVSDKGSDGEQSMLSVLPSSTPVRDAYTFYMNPGCGEAALKLPKMNPSDCVTLNFCNNPGWFVLTSLSGLVEPDSQSALAQSVALYSQCVATGLLKKDPQLRSGLEKMLSSRSADLVSPLEKNSSLKAVKLDYTPWVNDAESETARMFNLRSLTDDAAAGKSIEKCIDRLSALNNADGSFSWMKGMPGSEWITRQVMSCLGSLKKTGNLPDDKRLRSMLSGAVGFTDAAVGKEYSEIVRRNKGKYSLSSEISYFYDRTNATDSKPTGVIMEMYSDMMTRIPKEWRNLTLMEKASASILLHRAGGEAKEALAREILQSVRQFATYKDDKGLWFDNLKEGYFSPSPLLLTSRCLDAYREILPESDAISGFEQYLILSRQTTDWNLSLGEAGVASVVNSLLGDPDSSKKITTADSSVEIYLDGKPLALPVDSDSLAGNFYMNLSAEQASGATLTIHRHGDVPAWGGVMCRYVAPIKEVKAIDVPQLKIEKALLPVSTDANGKRASSASTRFVKGERIRVTLTLTADRELDYLFISDRLGAWMQPVAQLTHYTRQDNLWYLMETRNSAVNFYITSVSKGRYILTYEVNADRDGEYSTGIAEAQCLYYPMITAHSAGAVITVE